MNYLKKVDGYKSEMAKLRTAYDKAGEEDKTRIAKDMETIQGNIDSHLEKDAETRDFIEQIRSGEVDPKAGISGGTAAQKGGAKQLDAVTAATILKEAGGDKIKARNIAKQRGYSF